MSGEVGFGGQCGTVRQPSVIGGMQQFQASASDASMELCERCTAPP